MPRQTENHDDRRPRLPADAWGRAASFVPQSSVGRLVGLNKQLQREVVDRVSPGECFDHMGHCHGTPLPPGCRANCNRVYDAYCKLFEAILTAVASRIVSKSHFFDGFGIHSGGARRIVKLRRFNGVDHWMEGDIVWKITDELARELADAAVWHGAATSNGFVPVEFVLHDPVLIDGLGADIMTRIAQIQHPYVQVPAFNADAVHQDHESLTMRFDLRSRAGHVRTPRAHWRAQREPRDAR